MTKLVLLAVASILFSPITSAADQASNISDDQRASAISFEKLVNTAFKSMTSDQPVVKLDNGPGWVKRMHTLSNLTFDVKKTDSLLNPIIGFVDFSLRIDESPVVNTKEEILQATTFNESRFTYEISLNYSYKDGAWKYMNSRVRHFYDGRFSFDSEPSEERIIANRFIVPLHYWMPR